MVLLSIAPEQLTLSHKILLRFVYRLALLLAEDARDVATGGAFLIKCVSVLFEVLVAEGLIYFLVLLCLFNALLNVG